jgi:hypothetical protein
MMSIQLKIVIISFLSLGIIALVLFLWSAKSIEEVNVPSTANEYIINFEKQNSKLYFKSKTWGIAGNHEEILLSSSSFEEKKQYSKDECFIFYSSEVFYKKKGLDTLLVYIGASAISEIPKKFSSPIKIIQIELKNYDEVKDYGINYKKYSLSKVSIYKDK